jgi:hypothetical protein
VERQPILECFNINGVPPWLVAPVWPAKVEYFDTIPAQPGCDATIEQAGEQIGR